MVKKGVVSVEMDAMNRKFDTSSVIDTLEGLMTKVTKTSVNAQTVGAACACADRITDILKVHLEVEKLKLRERAIKTVT